MRKTIFIIPIHSAPLRLGPIDADFLVPATSGFPPFLAALGELRKTNKYSMVIFIICLWPLTPHLNFKEEGA